MGHLDRSHSLGLLVIMLGYLCGGIVPAIAELRGAIKRQVRQMTHLVDNLLNASRESWMSCLLAGLMVASNLGTMKIAPLVPRHPEPTAHRECPDPAPEDADPSEDATSEATGEATMVELRLDSRPSRSIPRCHPGTPWSKAISTATDRSTSCRARGPGHLLAAGRILRHRIQSLLC